MMSESGSPILCQEQSIECEARKLIDEVWGIRFRWSGFKPHLQKTLLRGSIYHQFTNRDNDPREKD